MPYDDGLSYIVAGKETLDPALAVRKLKALFHIEMLMVSGGGFINWTFLQNGLVDELSLVLSPVADGESGTVTLFEKGNAAGDPVTFTLKDVEKGRDNSIWLCYSVNNQRLMKWRIYKWI